MKAEPILARVNAILALSDDPTPTRRELQQLAAHLADLVRQEAATTRGVGNAAKTVQRMLATVKKRDENRRSLHYAWIDKHGRQCVCDGFRAFRLNDPLPLEPRPEDVGDGIDLDKVVPDIAAGTFDALPIPSVADIKAYMALKRAENVKGSSIYWDFGPGRPVVCAQYLLDLIAVLPDAVEIFVRRGSRGLLSPLYARSERGDAVLLPIRFCGGNADERAAQADALELLANYADKVQHNAAHSMPLDDFAALAQLAYQPA